MKLKIKATFKKNINEILRDCGYRLHPKDGNSYIKPVSRNAFYPRWHIYIEQNDNLYNFNILISILILFILPLYIGNAIKNWIRTTYVRHKFYKRK